MRIALVNEHRCEAAPGLTGICQACQSPTIPKCGKLRIWHWSHQRRRICDPWWEETEWHIAWKNQFPLDWQEIVQTGSDGELHVADVRLPDGCVLEFQHSPISEVERHSREIFYGSMIWIVDGLRRKRDQGNFAKTRRIISRDPLVYSGFDSECALLRDWIGRPTDVVFDFGVREEDITAFGRPVLWQLHPDPQRRVLLTPIYAESFIEMLHKGGPLQRVHYKPTPSPAIIPSHMGPKRWPDQRFQHARWIQRHRLRF